MGGRMGERTDGRAGGRTDGRTERRTDGWTVNYILTQTDGRMDIRTDGRTVIIIQEGEFPTGELTTGKITRCATSPQQRWKTPRRKPSESRWMCRAHGNQTPSASHGLSRRSPGGATY